MYELKYTLSADWYDCLAAELNKPYIKSLEGFLVSESLQGKTICPVSDKVFNAFELTPLSTVKVVILGQDPYHGPGQAQGLSFSVPENLSIPPSLKNIFKEIERDLSLLAPSHGCLESWAQQGVLLLNATLTVEQGKAGSHQGKGWEQFTDRVIELINEYCEDVVFLLWGGFAKKKGNLIDADKHHVLFSSHPSPLSVYRGFLGCSHFSQTNQWLISKNKNPINWQVD